MRIKQMPPTALRGQAGAAIDTFHRWWIETDGTMRADMPHFARQVFLSPETDGERIPEIGYLGRGSFIHEVMGGKFGADQAAAIRQADPRFEASVAAGFAIASTGRAVCDEVEMEVTPPGMTSPLHVAYYRIIVPVKFAPETFALVNLTLPRDDWRAKHIRPDTARPRVN
ncbi:hypothetical protein [Stappia stellulata]|uniref:hypothetical protein n=1 Tax=Stappia stellulata TaxID=71235 RepID=UPI0003FB4D3C|nr:hypothetical protein [Stappia stellulata]